MIPHRHGHEGGEPRRHLSRGPLALAKLVCVLGAVLLLHVVDTYAPWYFVIAGVAAAGLVASHYYELPRLAFLSRLTRSDRLAVWLAIAAWVVIGALHNLNDWLPDGRVYRPSHHGLWKTELVLGIALAAPVIHWLVSRLVPHLGLVSGRRFANEFALYVNFSGIALALWTGDAGISWSLLGAVFALVVLAELTLYATE